MRLYFLRHLSDNVCFEGGCADASVQRGLLPAPVPASDYKRWAGGPMWREGSATVLVPSPMHGKLIRVGEVLPLAVPFRKTFESRCWGEDPWLSTRRKEGRKGERERQALEKPATLTNMCRVGGEWEVRQSEACLTEGESLCWAEGTDVSAWMWTGVCELEGRGTCLTSHVHKSKYS